MILNYEKVTAIDDRGNTLKIATKIEVLGEKTRVIIIPQQDCRIKEVILHNGAHNFGADSYVYMDGYSKLTQYGGKIGEIKQLTYFGDAGHYKMPQTSGYFIGYNYMYAKQNGDYTLIGAASCNYYRTEFRFKGGDLQIAQCLENKQFSANEKIVLEDMYCSFGKDINCMLDTFAAEINKNHPPKKPKESPVGWCSWYCIGPNISERKIFNNLAVIKKRLPELKYIQIDDGFQPFMGDWLKVSDKFDRSMKEICQDIRKEGFEPAIWLAPFIASENSELLKNHPEYFVMGDDKKPLCTSEVTFIGWRDNPWYCLDGSNPAALKYIYDIVRTIYKDWGVKYFKLDANMWGAMPFGNRYDSRCTSVEAYRKGMQTIFDATEGDAFILGCNAPMWPSLGLVSGMRVTGDVVRTNKSISDLSDECFRRNWMNSLWDNDPDCLIMSNSRPQLFGAAGVLRKNKFKARMYKFNNVYIRASGGMVLSGDYVGKYSIADIDRCKRIINSPRIPAKFDENLEFGTIAYGNVKEYCIFNKTEKSPKSFNISIGKNAKVTDMYNNKPMNIVGKTITVTLKKYDCAWIKVEE